MRLAALQLLACGLLIMQLQLASATPSMWVSLHLNVPSPPGLTCIDHPEVGYGKHPGPSSLATQGIVFTLSNSVGAAVSSVCPGQTYSLMVDLGVGNNGHMFLTTTAGDLTSPNYALSSCGNGSRIATTSATQIWTQSLAFACPQLANRTSVFVRATYANGMGQQFFTNSITLAVDANCYNATCWNYVPPPSPSPGPPAPAPSPSPTAKPVYPDCINAALLANPCPLGKRCFYDSQCQPQMEDMSKALNPTCDNAQPLRNPWPSGQCCFYDSQCKPQCEDKTSSACTNSTNKPPPCSVTGCGWCSATNASVCDKCWSGYVLNVNTLKCDCAPGYSGSTSCKLCAAGTISYGGKLPTAACTACPAGRVPNPQQTECVVAGAWDHWGYDLTNRRWGYGETTINTTNVKNLTPKWTFTAGSDVTATPTVVGGRLYVPDSQCRMPRRAHTNTHATTQHTYVCLMRQSDAGTPSTVTSIPGRISSTQIAIAMIWCAARANRAPSETYNLLCPLTQSSADVRNVHTPRAVQASLPRRARTLTHTVRVPSVPQRYPTGVPCACMCAGAA